MDGTYESSDGPKPWDYCDHCGPAVEAYVYARMPSGKYLTYCGSCGTRFMDGLIFQGASITDYRTLIGLKNQRVGQDE